MIKICFLYLFFLFFLYSCTTEFGQNKVTDKFFFKNNNVKKEVLSDDNSFNSDYATVLNENTKIINDTIKVILPSKSRYKYLSLSFLNSLEMAIHDFNNEKLVYDIIFYENDTELYNIFQTNSKQGQVFIGPLTSEDTSIIKKYCDKNILIFSFASNRNIAGECVYLFNFFIEDDLRAIFNFFDINSKVALIYPDNNYGNYVNSIIKDFANTSDATFLYSLSYDENLENIRDVIRQLGKYDYRKNELERQKKLLLEKNDEISLASLKKLEKFETIGDLDFNNLIISDGNLRILEIAPLLPFYDIDPNHVRFVGTGLWDERSFFDEPSLQRAIFPGIEETKRKKFINNYLELYKIPPPRTATIIYDLAALLNFLLTRYETVNEIRDILNENNNFNGLDGKFLIKNNIIQREFSILQIENNDAKIIQ